MRWGLALVLVLVTGCVTSPKPVPVKPVPVPVASPAVDPLRTLVQSFVAASEAGRFDEVHALLAKPLRDRYSVKQLERDFTADPLAAARIAQLKRKANAPIVGSAESASLEWSVGRSLRLVHEAQGWRIAALE